MRRKMFSILTSSALLLQGMSFSTVLAANESKSHFEPMEEIETWTETVSDDNLTNPVENELDHGEYEGVSWTIYKDGTLTFGSGELENTTVIAPWPWLSSDYSDKITHIDGTAPLSLKGNCVYMFHDLSNVESIDLSGWDTSEITDMANMFSDCSSLTSLIFPSSGLDTSSVTQTVSMFNNCTSLPSLDLSNWDVSNLVYMSGMFSGCTSLTSIDLSGWVTSNVVEMSSVFSDCTSLASINLSGWDISNTTTMTSMFYKCTSLTSDGLSDISNWNTSNVSDTRWMFEDCSSLVSLDLSNWDTSNIRQMSDMFYGCSSLTSLDLSNWNTLRTIAMLQVGLECDNLEKIKYNSNCENFVLNFLEYLPEEWLWNLNDIGPYSQTEIPPLNEGENGILVRSDKIAYGKIGTSLWTLDQNGTLTIGEGRFENKDRDFRWPWWDYSDSIISINGEADFVAQGDYSSAFQYLSNLKSANFSGWNTSDVTNINCMFNGCESLTYLDLSNWDTSRVIEMNSMFTNCKSLTSLNLSDWDTSNVNNMNSMFYHCDSLPSLELLNWDVSKVEDMYAMFGYCTSLTSLDLSGWIASDHSFYGGGVFLYCSSLEELKYSSQAQKVTAYLSQDWKWSQNGQGSYAVSEIPPLAQGENGTLVRTNSVYEDLFPPQEGLVAYGKIGTAIWTLDKEGTLTIGEGEYESDTSLIHEN